MVAGEITAAPWQLCESLIARATLALAHVTDTGTAPGFRIFWLRGDHGASERAELAFATLEEGRHLVVGRHSECDVRLEHPAVALRHLLLRVRRDEAGALTLVGTDLGAELPLLVGPSAQPTRSFSAAGPTVLRLADTLLVALPVGDPSRAASPDESALRAAVIDADPAEARPIPRALEELAVHTMVSSISRTLIRPFAPPLPVEVVPRGSDTPFARVALRGPHGRVVVELSRAQLERVVLVGRYPRCRQGELAPFSASVSRVHAGLTVEGDDLVVIDLASTNGIGVNHTRDASAPRAIRVRSRGSIPLGPTDRIDVELCAGG